MSLPIEPFAADYKTADGWLPCRVVGVIAVDAWTPSQFVILLDGDDGCTLAHVVDRVRRTAEGVPSHGRK